MKTVSIVIPVYNAENYIEKTVESVLDSTYRDFELLLIDDGSSDNSIGVCEEMRKKDPRIRIVSKPNGGVSSARNRGIEEAEGSYIAFVDDDDLISRDYLEKLVACIDDNELDWVACGYKNMYVDDDPVTYDTGDPVFVEDVMYKGPQAAELARNAVLYGPNGCSITSNDMGIYRRSVIVDNGLKLDETMDYGEDLLFNYLLAGRVKGFAYITEPLYCYVQREESAQHRINKSELIDKVMGLIGKMDDLRLEEKEAVNDNLLAWVIMMVLHVFKEYLFKIEDSDERKRAYAEMDGYLKDDKVGALWKKCRVRNVNAIGPFRIKRLIFFVLVKSRRYALLESIWKGFGRKSPH